MIKTHVHLVLKRSSDYLVAVCWSYLDARLLMKDGGLTFSDYYIKKFPITRY